MVLHFAMPRTEASVEFRKETAASAAVAPCWEIRTYIESV